ncbi:hypothetical protein [uncultured Marivita sp.]|uniref:hypothetical protein n=1 Tax=uncultured Marivita sp. TaxID=888080 RepID=UPI002627ED8A|nr:hypothetical protein [uncultured Marivita sp.]
MGRTVWIIVGAVVVVIGIWMYSSGGDGSATAPVEDVNTTTLEGDAPDDPVDVPADGAETDN